LSKKFSRGTVAAVIDAHHHLWRYTAEEYGWIDGTMRVIRQNFLVPELKMTISKAGVDGTVAVQARQTLQETRWLLDLANSTDVIQGVVGWAPIADPDFLAKIEAFTGERKLLGLRHVIQGEPDGFMLGDDFNRGIGELERMGLVYDVLVYERQLEEAIQFIDRHPRQVFVLNHIAKPRIKEQLLEPWATNLKKLARRDNVWCKVSGLVTEADWGVWTDEHLKPYLDVVVEAFGVRRLMAGSDWPVCLVASGYERWFDTLRQYFAAFSENERTCVFGATAHKVYGLQGTKDLIAGGE
jgi:L-fuconolactonase